MQRILGQDHALGVLRRAVRSGRVHHAWLFSGPGGVGKHTAAVAFARVLLDPEARVGADGAIEVDADSAVGREIEAGTHPDLHLIHKEQALLSEDRELRERKQSNIPIALLRERMLGGLVGGKHHEAVAYLTPMRGHAKVFIVDEAELLDQYGQNAMLKTLEEPPAATYFILVTKQIERLLPTIRSRCQHVRFSALDDEAMGRWMEQANLEVPPAQRRWIEEFAEGSPGVALLAAEYGLYGWHEAMQPLYGELERGRFAVSMGETMAALIEEFAVAWVKNHKNASKDAANKDGARLMLAMLGSYARQRLREACERGGNVDRWMVLGDVLRDAERQMYLNVNLKMLLENLAVQWHLKQTELAGA